jgi:hypothetical protein
VRVGVKTSCVNRLAEFEDVAGLGKHLKMP